MAIANCKTVIKNFHQIKFDWRIENYDYTKTYNNVYQNESNIIMVMLRAEFEKGKVNRSNPHLMFTSLDDKKNSSPKKFMFSVTTIGSLCIQVARRDWPKLYLNESYSSYLTFLNEGNYKQVMTGKDLILEFDIQIISTNSERLSTFDNSQISKDFRTALDNQALCDCQFIIGNESIGAHMIFIAANCPALEKELETSENKLVVQDCSKDAFMEFLKFIYSAKMDRKGLNIVIEVAALADKYDFRRLKDYCESVLHDKIYSENPDIIYQSCFTYNLSQKLKKDAYRQIQRLFEDINQKLPDDFIDDPNHVHNLLMITEKLMDGLKARQPPQVQDSQAQPDVHGENYDDAQRDVSENNKVNQLDVTREMLESCSLYLTAENGNVTNPDDEKDISNSDDNDEHDLNVTFSGGDVDGLEYDEFELEISTKDQSDSDIHAEIEGYVFMENTNVPSYPHVLEEIIEEIEPDAEMFTNEIEAEKLTELDFEIDPNDEGSTFKQTVKKPEKELQAEE